MITIKQIANELNVSPTTVSNVIHGNYRKVSAENVERISQKLKERNYIPNMGARMLAQGGSKIIGVVMNIRYYKQESGERYEFGYKLFHSTLLSVLEREIRKNDYYMMYYVSKDVNEILTVVGQWNIDGMVIHGLDEEDCCRLVQEVKKPIVFIDCAFTTENCFSNVGLYDRYGGYLATHHFLENGHSRIGFLTYSDPPKGYIGERYEGYEQALKEYGLEADRESIVYLSPYDEERMQIYGRLYQERERFTALLVDSDYYAVELMSYFQDRGMQIPDEMSIIGFDNNSFSRVVRPKLTTVHQDVELKAVKAMELLQEHLQNPDQPYKRIILPVRLIKRETVKNISENLNRF